MNIVTVGVDLAKSVFSVCELDGFGHVLRRQDLRRGPFLPCDWPSYPAGTALAMEVCSGAHLWARRCLTYGLEPRIIATQLVTPFRKGHRTKNDRADAEAIALAARQATCVSFLSSPSTSRLGCLGTGCAKTARRSHWLSETASAAYWPSSGCQQWPQSPGQNHHGP